jgi:hypothetical protein
MCAYAEPVTHTYTILSALGLIGDEEAFAGAQRYMIARANFKGVVRTEQFCQLVWKSSTALPVSDSLIWQNSWGILLMPFRLRLEMVSAPLTKREDRVTHDGLATVVLAGSLGGLAQGPSVPADFLEPRLSWTNS